MLSKIHWGAVVCVTGAVIGCQSSPPNMTLLGEPLPPAPQAEVAPVAIQTAEPIQASYRVEPAAPDRTATLPASSAAAYPFQPQEPTRTQITKADVINWSARGVPDEVIIERLTRSKTAFQLTAADQNELRDKGVSKPVISAMREMWRR